MDLDYLQNVLLPKREAERHLNKPVSYVAYKQNESKEYSLEQLFDKFMLERNK